MDGNPDNQSVIVNAILRNQLHEISALRQLHFSLQQVAQDLDALCEVFSPNLRTVLLEPPCCNSIIIRDMENFTDSRQVDSATAEDDLSHLPLHNHIIHRSSQTPYLLLSDTYLHARLVDISKECRSGTSGGTSRPFEQLQLESFIALLPLLNRWMAKTDDSQPIQTAFILIHEGIRRFQSQQLFFTLPSSGNDKKLLRADWFGIMDSLSVCANDETFMSSFPWRDALLDLIKCLSSVAWNNG
eukprot:GILI01020406.1.p1 GENE.GILI01020406.1~~GILI01020406.1.p1  ORF type:complete len:243 (+),score=19.16 GILI01020406.1:56-784(+)